MTTVSSTSGTPLPAPTAVTTPAIVSVMVRSRVIEPVSIHSIAAWAVARTASTATATTSTQARFVVGSDVTRIQGNATSVSWVSTTVIAAARTTTVVIVMTRELDMTGPAHSVVGVRQATARMVSV